MEKSQQRKLWTIFDMFQSIFGKIDKFGCWDLERISSDAGTTKLAEFI